MKKPYQLEACIETFEQAESAQKIGVDRFELCSRLDLDGLTPELDLLSSIVQSFEIPVHAMIRPRPGDFHYSLPEVKAMKDQIKAVRSAGASGVVLGTLDGKGLIDTTVLSELIEVANGMAVTFHKAIDSTSDIFTALKQLQSFHKIEYILTSGKAHTAWEGRHLLRKMVMQSRGAPQIIAAGKINPGNVESLHSRVRAPWYHGKSFC